MSLFREDLSEIEKEIYLQGARHALEAFGVWKDGKQYVNLQMMRTISECIEIIEDAIDYMPEQK